jgi:hypothetical protein
VWAWARADFDKKASEMARQGYRLHDLTCFGSAGPGPAYNAVWTRTNDDRSAIWGWTRADFDKKASEMVARGYSPLVLNACESDGVPVYNAVWGKAREARHAVWGWARADLDKKAEEMATKGYRLASINAVAPRNAPESFNAIWVKTNEDHPSVWGWARADFDKKASEMSTAGYRFIDLNSYASPATGKTLYNAIWAKRQDEQGVVWGWARADFDRKNAELAGRGFRLSRIHAQAPARTCEISGRLIGGEAYWSLTSVGVRGPGDYSQRPADPVQVGADGAYVFPGLVRGRYKVYTDMRADLGTGFKPAQHIVDCLADKQTGIDFTWPMATSESAAGTKPGPGLGKQ